MYLLLHLARSITQDTPCWNCYVSGVPRLGSGIVCSENPSLCWHAQGDLWMWYVCGMNVWMYAFTILASPWVGDSWSRWRDCGKVEHAKEKVEAMSSSLARDPRSQALGRSSPGLEEAAMCVEKYRSWPEQATNPWERDYVSLGKQVNCPQLLPVARKKLVCEKLLCSCDQISLLSVNLAYADTQHFILSCC